MNKKDGGPAFPRPGTDCNVPNKGMSLRDWFAAMASDNDITEQQNIEWNRIREETGSCPNFPNPLTRAQARYRHADAMIEQKYKGEE